MIIVILVQGRSINTNYENDIVENQQHTLIYIIDKMEIFYTY